MKGRCFFCLSTLFILVFVQTVFPQCELQIVYVTATGTKYHRDGCSYLSGGKIAKTLQQAVNEGYTACSVCKPPTLPCSSDAPDLSVSKRHQGDFRAGQNGTFRIVVQNIGNVATSGRVNVLDNLPAGLTYVSSAAPGWTFETFFGMPNWSRNDAIAPGASSEIALVVRIGENASGQLTNEVTVGNAGDTNSVNDSASDSVEVLASFSAKKTFYFPHFGDGSGLSTMFSITNLSVSTLNGTLSCFDNAGNSLSVPFSTGTDDSIPLILAPHQTRVFQTNGTSDPFKVGFVRVELDQEEVTGVAIFRYAGGPEASVLPVAHGREFSLFVERNADLDTGIAMCRSGTEPIMLKLYDLEGSLFTTRSYDFNGCQKAEFLGQIFTLPQSFSGVLTMESAGPFSAVGLRFGSSVLSTIPLFDFLTFRTHFSPHGGARQAIIDAIESAQTAIDIAIYSFTTDEIADALIAAKARGVQIRVVADEGQSAGSGSEIGRLISAGLNLQKSDGGSGGIMHHKFAIFDGKLLLTGSYNWSANAEDSNYENAVFIRALEVVEKYQAHFEEVWR